MSGGLTATGLVVLLLALIGAGVGLYYAYICLQARPLRPKKHKDAECGPLIPPDPDVNGNHEDVPLEASAPLHDDADPEHKLHPDLTDHDASSPAPEGADSPEPQKDKEDVLISVGDDVPPATVTHEKETTPVPKLVAPVGFVVPPPAGSSQETPLDHHPAPRNLQTQPEKIESPPSSSSGPVPVYIPSPPQKKPIAISDEEDGLLLHEPPPHDDSLNPELCATLNPELCATLPVSHSPRKPCVREELETTPQNNPATSPPKPEEVAPATTTRQPAAAIPKVDITPEPEAQPVVVVVPHTAPSYPEKDELKPVGKAVETLPSENFDKLAPVCMKDKECPPSAATSNDLNKEESVPVSEVPAIKAVPSESLSVEPKNPINNEAGADSDDSLSAGDPSESTEPTLKSVENNEAAKVSTENDRVEPIPENIEVHEEPRSVSSCSVSSEDLVPPSHTPVTADVKPQADTEPIAPLDSSPLQPREDGVVASDMPASLVAAPEPDSNIPPANTTEQNVSTPEGKNEPNVPLHSSPDVTEVLSDASSVESDLNIPAEMPLTPPTAEKDPGKETPVTPSLPAADIPIDASNIPMEAYNVMLDDTSDEEGSPLPVIKEEGSVENNSEGTDTESSEPEVTEYSFSSGPSAPSTTGVLADEVSCTMEPKVTKISPIADIDGSESEGSEISDEDSEDDLASLPKVSDDEVQDNTGPLLQNKDIAEEKPADAFEKSNIIAGHSDTSEQDAASDREPVISSNGTATSETPDTAGKLTESEMSDSGDSDTESEGAEAEVELKEEIVSIPAVVSDNTNNHTAVPAESLTSPSTNHIGKPAEACPPKPQLLKDPKGNSNSLEEIPNVTDDDGLSLSPSDSCDLSDGEVTTSTPKKSMIPRLVKQNEA